MSKRNKTTKANKAAPIATIGDNTEIEHDAIVGEALSVVRLWESAEKTAQNADAMAVHVVIRAHEFGFFGDSANVANWHTVATKEVRTALLDTILTDLFSIEKPKASERQRLQRIRLVVPALIKSGGTNVFSLSKTNVLMLTTDCEYFKNCGIKAEVEGRMGLSIIQLDRGARKYLKGELPVDKRATLVTTTPAYAHIQRPPFWFYRGDRGVVVTKVARNTHTYTITTYVLTTISLSAGCVTRECVCKAVAPATVPVSSTISSRDGRILRRRNNRATIRRALGRLNCKV